MNGNTNNVVNKTLNETVKNFLSSCLSTTKNNSLRSEKKNNFGSIKKRKLVPSCWIVKVDKNVSCGKWNASKRQCVKRQVS